jgi:hypothetical protein
MAAIPTPDLAVPYAAPKQVKTMADVQPIAPKNGCGLGQLVVLDRTSKEDRACAWCFDGGEDTYSIDRTTRTRLAPWS